MAKTAAEIMARPGFANLVAQALATTISQYTKTPAAAQEAFLADPLEKVDSPPGAALPKIDVGAFIRFESSGFGVEIFLGLPFALFAIYYENIFQEVSESLNRENQDLPGELLNIAFGIVDPQTRQKDFQLYSSFPKSVSGSDLTKLLKDLPAERVRVPMMSAGIFFEAWIFPKNTIAHSWAYTLKPA